MARGHVRKRHDKFFKRFTIGGSIFGMITILIFAVTLVIDMVGGNVFLTDYLREYTATFISDGALIDQKTYKRGEVLEQPGIPEKQSDGEDNYIFIGWDITGEGLPDILPTNMYFSFTAKACFFSTGKLHLSLEDLMNMDLETLLQLLEDLNIDWEQFMKMFNLSLEDLMNLLQSKPVLTFTADTSSYVSYFRSTSYGDFNFKKKKYNQADKTFPNDIVSTIHPLRYTSDRLSGVAALGGLPEGFSYVHYDIEYRTKKSPFPVPDCEKDKDEYGSIDNDAYVLTNPVDSAYQTTAVYCPALWDVIKVLNFGQYSSYEIRMDEEKYRRYAHEKFLNVPSEYDEVISNIISEQKWGSNDYYYVDKVGKYVESAAEFCMLPDEETGKLHKNADPIFGMLESEKASDFDFNTLAIMIFRKLGIPARMVQGYLVPGIEEGENIVTLLNQHYWCEIYVDGIGWMICDCTNGEGMIGINPYGGSYNNKDNPITDDKKPEEFEEEEYVTEDLSGDVSNSGPGDKLDDVHQVFNFTSDYEGTLFFRSRAYNKYFPSGKWGAVDNYKEYVGSYVSSYGNPLTLSYKVADKMYESKDVNIHYEANMTNGLAPAYFNTINGKYGVTNTDLYSSSKVEANTNETYKTTHIAVTTAALSQASTKAAEMDYSFRNVENTYRSFVYSYGNYLEYDVMAYQSYFENLANEYIWSAGGYSSQADLIVKIQNIFKYNFNYNINYAPYPEGQDPIISFLERREGICNNFASTATLFYRYMGIPARFVTGYGAKSEGTGIINEVTTLQAHAWVEVYFDGVGWISVDPTGFDDGHGDGSYYGSGFGGGGVDQFGDKIEKTIIKLNFDNILNYGYDISKDSYTYKGVTYYHYSKTYDRQPLPTGFVTISSDTYIPSTHYVVIDDSAIAAAGAYAPGEYEIDAVVNVFEYSTGKNVTEEYYEVENPTFELSIEERDLGEITVSPSIGSINYSGTPFYFNEEYCNNNGITFYIYNAYNLASGHYVEKFIVDEILIDGTVTQIQLSGRLVIRDEYGNDVSSYYNYEFNEITIGVNI